MCVCVCVRARVFMCVYIYIYMCVCVCVYLAGYGLDVWGSSPGRSRDWLWGLLTLLPHEYRSFFRWEETGRDIKMAVHFVELGQRMREALRAWVVCLSFTCVLGDIMNSHLP